MGAKEQVIELLKKADITVNGKRPWDIQVHDERLYDRVLAEANLGLGEAYMDGWWDCKALDQFFAKLLAARLDKKVRPLAMLPHYVKSKVLNMQTKTRSKKVAQEHYDVGNDLYELMLGRTMQYTCGFWERAKTLDQAQTDKLELVARKLKLKPGMKVLELGGGFGGLAHYLASKYKCHVTTYNISKEQVAYGKAWCKGLPVTFVEADYREAKKLPAGSFDRVVSIGMLEHVGHRNYKGLMELAAHAMRDDGVFVLHTIGTIKSVQYTDPWIDRYIFPNSHLPSIAQMSKAMEGSLIVEDWHNFGAYYDPTLMAWHANFEKSWPKIKESYDERFYRMWRYYLLSCAGAFRVRNIQLWQVVLTKHGYPGGYVRPTL